MNKQDGLALLGASLMSMSMAAHAEMDMQSCMMERLAGASDTMTVAELKAACTTPPSADAKTAVVTRRVQEENVGYNKRYALTPHRINYVLPLSYDQRRPSSAPFRNESTEGDVNAQKIETKFQLSFKFPLLLDAFGADGDLMAGYTQRSFWQMYNSAASRPFRETNYEPEIWYQYPVNRSALGWNMVSASIGLNHQSNGRGQEYSRSWNRLMGGLIFEHGEYAIALRPWLRIKESTDDDNPDISQYLGRFDLAIGRKFGNHSLDLQLRNNLKTQENRGSVQLGWSFPLSRSPQLRGYVQWFSGYGESLMDYNHYQNTLGIGVQMADW